MTLPDATAMATGVTFLTNAWNSWALLTTLLGLAGAMIMGRKGFSFILGLLRKIR